MSDERPKTPKARPPRRRDATVFSSPSRGEGAPPADGASTPSTIPGPTVPSVLEQLRKAPSARLQTEVRVASGGMGAIDVAVDRALDRRVAVKTLHPHLRSDPRAVRMFLHEARLTGLLEHPHIVPVYEIGERDGDLFFAMKLVEGRTLADVIHALPGGALDTATLYALLDVFAKVCDALAFAHSRGILHCDVKPANVMVGDFGQVFLTDWGIARRLATATEEVAPPSSTSGTTATSTIIGTPGYMSPEQARGDRARLDVRSDVFLLGALLYEILAHRAPYVGASRSETLAFATAGTFPPPRGVAGEAAVPLELERIVLRAMAPAPEDRYPSVSALKDDVVLFMRGGAEFPRRTFAAGDVIIREGESGEAAYIIVDGRCEISKASTKGPQTLRRVGPGEVFGEMAILTRAARSATVTALEATTVLVVTSAVLEQEMAALKPWMATLLESLALRFRDADSLPRTIAPERIVNQALMTIETWGSFDSHGARTMPWSALAAEVDAQLGVGSGELSRALAAYGIAVDENGAVTMAASEGLRARLRADLGAN